MSNAFSTWIKSSSALLLSKQDCHAFCSQPGETVATTTHRVRASLQWSTTWRKIYIMAILLKLLGLTGAASLAKVCRRRGSNFAEICLKNQVAHCFIILTALIASRASAVGTGKKLARTVPDIFPTRINIFTNVQTKCCYGWHRVKSCIFGFVIAGGRSLKQNLTSQILDLLGYIHVFKVWLKFFACDLPLLAAMCYCAITCTSNVVFIS